MATSLPGRLELLQELAEVTADRVPGDLTASARSVVGRAGERLRLGPSTVVALAGATGSGKSSLFNALAGRDVAEVGVRRPTTSAVLAASFGDADRSLLDWLGVDRRLELPPVMKGMEQLVLLDLPDHDSTETAHRARVDEMVRVVDQFCFVVDPQKYADQALHERYLRPLAAHREVIVVVLNQADRLTPPQLDACLKDLRRLLADDGLAEVPLLATSAVTGAGVDELRRRLARTAAHKGAATRRLAADVSELGAAFDDATRGRVREAPTPSGVHALNEALRVAAGVPQVVDATAAAMVHRGMLATGWPLTKWLRRLRPDPLRRLRIGGGGDDPAAAITPRSSLDARGAVATAQVSTALRALATELAEGFPPRWRDKLSEAVHVNEPTLPDALDEAIVAADLGTRRAPLWWSLLRLLQWLLIAAVLVGLLWLTANAALGYFGLPPLPGLPLTLPGGLQVPTPTALTFGGLAVGLLLAACGRLLVGLGARSARRRAARVLRARVRDVADDLVLAPARDELARHARARELIRELTR